MLKINSVQWRFVAVIVGIVALTAVTLSIIFTQAIAYGGNSIVDDALRIAAEDYLERLRDDPAAKPPDSPSFSFWRPDDPTLPGEVRQMPPSGTDKGFNLLIGDRHYRGLSFGFGSDRWLVLTDNTRRMAVRQNVRQIMLAVSVVVVLLALGAGFWVSNVLLNPINRMLRAALDSKDSERLDIAATTYPDNEIGELARALDDYSLRLQGFIEREQAFAADISHELRTPMTVILNTCEVISADPSISPPTLKRLQRIERAAGEMSQLVNALLVLAKEPPGTHRNQQVSISNVIRRSTELFRHQLDGKPVSLEIRQSEDFSVPTSEALLYATVSNLIRNAFAYTESGTVLIDCADRTLTVHNPATGIPESYLIQGDVGTPQQNPPKTVGIGLSLVQRICRHENWLLDVKSSKSSGSTVSIVFPPRPPIP